MATFQKRKSIFRILISRIFLLIIIINGAITGYIIWDEIKTENSSKEKQANEIIAEIGNMLNFMADNIESIEQNYRYKHNKIASNVKNRINIINVNSQRRA